MDILAENCYCGCTRRCLCTVKSSRIYLHCISIAIIPTIVTATWTKRTWPILPHIYATYIHVTRTVCQFPLFASDSHHVSHYSQIQRFKFPLRHNLLRKLNTRKRKQMEISLETNRERERVDGIHVFSWSWAIIGNWCTYTHSRR